MMEKKTRTRFFIILGVIFIAVIIATIVLLNTFLKTTETPETNKTPVVALKNPTLKTTPISSGYEAPTAIVSTGNPSDKRLFVVERAGRIISFTPGENTPPRVFLDIRDRVQAGGEMGLLGLAFHPDYTQNGELFVNYIDKTQTTVVARFRAPDKQAAASDSEQKILTVKQPYANHNGGDLLFGPDRYLYVALGDGGSAGDPENRAQDMNNLLGKLLRLDISKGNPYEIPVTNPFKDGGAKPEIWASGLRNPWRISFDKKTGDLYIADVGQGKLEEINMKKADSKGGENYGWRCFEGTLPYNQTGCQDASRYIEPVLEYNHDENRCSVTGGYVYRGQEHPALSGKYFYGDFCNGQLFYAEQKDGTWTQTLALATNFSISTFGQDSTGELYLADFNSGTIHKLTDTAN